MNILELEKRDLDSAISLWKSIDGVSLNESDSPEALTRLLNRNPGLSFIAKSSDGATVGTVLCGHNGRAGQIYHLAVHPSHRGNGLGAKLVERCLGRLREENIPRCNIFVYIENQCRH